MCTNPRLVCALQCYMDDLVDCFEDFVTKSLVIISLAIGAVIVMIGYCLKAMTEHNMILQSSSHRLGSNSMATTDPGRRRGGTDPAALNYSFAIQNADESSPISDSNNQNIYNENIRKSRSNTQKSKHGINMSYVNSNFGNTSSGAESRSYTGDYTGDSVPNFDEEVLRTVGSASFKEGASKPSIKRDDSCSRAQLRSVPACIPNPDHLSKPRACPRSLQKTSCCSMCCADDDRL